MSTVIYRHNRRSGEIHTGILRTSGQVAFPEVCNTDVMEDWEELTVNEALQKIGEGKASWCEHCRE